jgi:hypothetical protein
MGDTDQYGNQLVVKVDKTDANRPTQVTFSDGTVYDPEKAADYRETTIKTEADEGGRVKQSEKQAEVNVEEAENAYKAVQTYEKVERQLGEVTKALDAGAESGPIAKYFPTLTNATTQLMHLRDKMALEEIGEYTFGSLSEAEGDWLKSTSVPDLDEPQLRAWAAKRVEAVQRLGDAARYEEKMRRNNLTPDPDIVTEIKYGGGFTYDDEI